MSRVWSVTVMAAFVGAAAMLAGCSDARQPQEPAKTSTEAPTAASAEVDPEIEQELAKLSPEDRKLALAQKVCPVTAEPLGSMGPPLKVTVDGKSFFICCEGCREEAEKNFAEHLAKVQASAGDDATR
jgi:hypothetical protein